MGKFTDSFLGQMMSENGMPSSKRWVTATVAAALVWCIVYSTMKAGAAAERYSIIVATMFFIGVMAGVATLPQIVSLIRGGNAPKEDKPIDEPKQD